MKNWNWASFIIGIVIGALLTTGAGFYMMHKAVSDKEAGRIPGLTMLKDNETGSTFDAMSIKVMQTLSSKTALAHTGVKRSYSDKPVYTFGTLVFYIAPDNVSLYDDMVIEIPKGKSLVQVGTYEYETVEKKKKTVPAVSIK